MRKISLIAAAALAGLALAVTQPAVAKGPKGPGWKAAGGNPHGFSHGRKQGWRSVNRPPGWDQGRKTGWHGMSVPPGWSEPRYWPMR